MLRRSLIVVCAFAMMAGYCAVPAAAQSSGTCIGVGTGFVVPFPPGVFNCVYMMYSFGSYDCDLYYPCAAPAGASETAPGP
jgi:hypothetical protein